MVKVAPLHAVTEARVRSTAAVRLPSKIWFSRSAWSTSMPLWDTSRMAKFCDAGRRRADVARFLRQKILSHVRNKISDFPSRQAQSKRAARMRTQAISRPLSSSRPRAVGRSPGQDERGDGRSPIPR